MTLTKIEIAIGLLSAMFATPGRLRIVDVLAAGKARGVSSRTMRRAKATLRLREIHNGPHPAFWERGEDPIQPPPETA